MTELYDARLKKIDEIMDYFDFASVANTMECIGWFWIDDKTEPYTEGVIRAWARRFMLGTIKNDEERVAHRTWGFEFEVSGTYAILSFSPHWRDA